MMGSVVDQIMRRMPRGKWFTSRELANLMDTGHCPSSVTQRLRRMKNAGIVKSRREGRSILYMRVSS